MTAKPQSFDYHAFPMPRLQRRLISQRHFAWLLCLVLLLPIAQTVASWHLLSHANSGQVDEGDSGKAIHQAHCDLCLSAAALMGGAPLASSPDLRQLKAFHEAAVADSGGIAVSAPLLAYDSRAPPFPLH